jgi:hypothetical protein
MHVTDCRRTVISCSNPSYIESTRAAIEVRISICASVEGEKISFWRQQGFVLSGECKTTQRGLKAALRGAQITKQEYQVRVRPVAEQLLIKAAESGNKTEVQVCLIVYICCRCVDTH